MGRVACSDCHFRHGACRRPDADQSRACAWFGPHCRINQGAKALAAALRDGPLVALALALCATLETAAWMIARA